MKPFPFLRILFGSAVLVAASAGCSETHRCGGQKIDEPRSGAVDDAIVIDIPWKLRLSESVREGGHQTWRSNPELAAGVKIRGLLAVHPPDPTIDDPATYSVVWEGWTEDGRPSLVLEKSISAESYIWSFKGPSVRIYLFENPGDVWIATKIVVIPRRP